MGKFWRCSFWEKGNFIIMNSNMVKPEKFDHLHLVYHFTVPLTNLKELINFYSSWIHQKTNGFRMISGGIEGHQFAWNSRNIRSEIWRWSYASEIRQRSLRTSSKNWRTSRTEENKDFFFAKDKRSHLLQSTFWEEAGTCVFKVKFKYFLVRWT